jgi:hypothetical protein
MADLLADDNRFGFIIMDGNGALFGTLQGNTRDVLHKFTVDLPKKHGTFRCCCFQLLTVLSRSRWSIGVAFCTFAIGETTQLRAKSSRNSGTNVHHKR